MVNFINLAAVATRLIAENGREMTIVKASRDPIDPEKPWRGNDDGGVDEITAVVAITRYDETEIDGEKIKSGDRKGWVGAVAGKKLETFNYVFDGDVRWNIKKTKVIQPSTIVVAYRFQLRSG